MTMVRIEVAESGIHGLGCFSKELIEAGQLVWKFDEKFDVVMKKDFIDGLPTGAKENLLNYAFINKVTGDYILCSDDSKFTNHSPTPNVTCLIPDGSSGNELECYAARRILPGEEITNDYTSFEDYPGVLPAE